MRTDFPRAQDITGGLKVPSNYGNWAGLDMLFGPRLEHSVGATPASQWKVNVSTLIRERGLPHLRFGNIPVKGMYSKGKDAHVVGKALGKGNKNVVGCDLTKNCPPQVPTSAAAEVAMQVKSWLNCTPRQPSRHATPPRKLAFFPRTLHEIYVRYRRQLPTTTSPQPRLL